MKTHCEIDGKLCSKCCEVLTINEKYHLRAWRAYVRRHGADPEQPELSKIAGMIRKISKRRAKKINPGLVKAVKNNQSYFTCKNYQGGKCADYANRPWMCSSYPLYGKSETEWGEYLRSGESIIGIYRDDCTYYDESRFGRES